MASSSKQALENFDRWWFRNLEKDLANLKVVNPTLIRYIFIQKILIEYFKDSKAFTENLSDTKDVNPNVYDYNPK